MEWRKLLTRGRPAFLRASSNDIDRGDKLKYYNLEMKFYKLWFEEKEDLYKNYLQLMKFIFLFNDTFFLLFLDLPLPFFSNLISTIKKKKELFNNFKLKRSMSGIDWVWSNKWSSFFKEIIEFTIFSSGIVVLSYLVGSSWDSDVDFSEFFKWNFFART